MIFDERARIPHAAYCNCCRTAFSVAEWLRRPVKGDPVDYGHGMVLDFRDCPCGSTLTRNVAPG